MQDSSKGTHAKPFLISDWLNGQIVKHCNACGINFTDDVNACINHVRILDKTRAASVMDTVAISTEVCKL